MNTAMEMARRMPSATVMSHQILGRVYHGGYERYTGLGGTPEILTISMRICADSKRLPLAVPVTACQNGTRERGGSGPRGAEYRHG